MLKASGDAKSRLNELSIWIVVELCTEQPIKKLKLDTCSEVIAVVYSA